MQVPRVMFTFLSLANVQQRGQPIGGMDVQIGDPVSVFIAKEDGTEYAVPAYLIGLHPDIDLMTFDFAFAVEGFPDLYLPVRSLAARFVKREVAGAPVEAPRPNGRPQLQVVRKVYQDQAPDMGEGVAEHGDPGERQPQPGDELPVRFTVLNKYRSFANQWPGTDGNYIVNNDGQPRFFMTFLNRGAAMEFLAAFLKIREGFDQIEEIDGLEGPGEYRVKAYHGPAKPVALEFPMKDEIWLEMTSDMPVGATIPHQSKWAFQILYPSKTAADADVERFKQKFPDLTAKPVDD